MKFELVGYGTGGQHLHAPFIVAARGIELAGVVARAPATIAKVEADLPGTSIYSSLAAMIDAGGIDAVTITTPPQTRREFVLETIEAGLHVVADKPFASSAEAGRALDAAAKAKGVVLGVYHNRPYDADFQTLRKDLGRIWRVHSRMDQDSPETLEAGPTGGLLRDPGSHVVDQMLWLIGPQSRTMRSLTSLNSPKAAPMPASPSRCGTRAARIPTSRRANGTVSTCGSCASMPKAAATSRERATCRRRRSSLAGAPPTTSPAAATRRGRTGRYS